jgi:hypothetical protein
MEDDPDFAHMVRQLVEEAKAADRGNVIAWGERSVAGGTISNSTIYTGDINRADEPDQPKPGG